MSYPYRVVRFVWLEAVLLAFLLQNCPSPGPQNLNSSASFKISSQVKLLKPLKIPIGPLHLLRPTEESTDTADNTKKAEKEDISVLLDGLDSMVSEVYECVKGESWRYRM